MDDRVANSVKVTSSLTVVSPLQGWSTPLDEAPDPVFAGRMLGDGLAIDPTGTTLYAPCAGTLITVPESKHAVTLRAHNGMEILLHVGIDTVGLRGEGFELHVREGQQVAVGERLISFDLDLLARKARSVLTPVVLTGGTGLTITRRSQDTRVEVGEFLMEVSVLNPSLHPEVSVAQRDLARDALEHTVIVQFEHGIHARPAALIASAVKNLAANVSIVAGDRNANARSPVALMGLGIRRGDRITIRASGADSAAAITALEQTLLGADAPERPTSASPRASPESEPSTAAARSVSPDIERGGELPAVVASRGLAVGVAYQLSRTELEIAESGTDPAQERVALDGARATVCAQLSRTIEQGHGASAAIAQAHLALMDDPELLERARTLIELGKSAGFAWRGALREAIDLLRNLGDERMRERADDLLDLESRVLSALGGHSSAQAELPADSVVLAQELLPSQLVALQPDRLAGICLARGGATSHVAIIAAAMDVPMLVAAGRGILRIATGTPVVLDAEGGRLHVAPPSHALELARSQILERRRLRAAAQAAAQREARTADGTRIEVFANVGSVSEAQLAVRNGAEGCGLLRTEFLFLERHSAPDVAEQAAQYQQIAQALGGRPLTIRTLDVGGDKPIPYLPLPSEANPALGLRGIRTSLWRPDLLRVQLQAVLQVRPAGQCRVLLPMITDPEEIRAVRAVLAELSAATDFPEPISLGAMIETPASAVRADWIAREADFLSIGTNDLTQYTLAMDRGQPDLAARLDGLHPAVLRLIARTSEAAGRHACGVAVCGGLASDVEAVPVLIGLGLHELSMVPAVIPSMKALIATLRAEECAALAAAALEVETAQEVRSLVRKTIPAIQSGVSAVSS